MPPKPAPKLTKKQLDQQKKEQARLQKQKQQEQAAAQKARLEEQQRIRQIERKKKSEQQRLRIVFQKQKYYPTLQEHIKHQSQSFSKLLKQQKWRKFTTPYHKDYSVQGTNLSTFTNLFSMYEHKDAQKTLAQCQQSQIYIQKLQQKMLQHRANYNVAEQKQCMRAIQKLQRQQLNKLQQIMIQYANKAQQMQQKNVQEAKKKNQQNAAQKATKPIDSIHCLSQNFKLGMYINTVSTKTYNKYNPIAIKEFGFNSELPPKWGNNNTIVKFQWVNFNQFSPNNKEEFRIVGGVFNLEFFQMFVGTKKTNNICIKRQYRGKQIIGPKFKLAPSAIKQPFKVTYEIPKYVFMAPYTKSTIKIAQYEAATSKWTILPNQSITEYQQNQKRVCCRVLRPEPIALVQNKCADYPYIAWQLRTVEQGKVLLDFQLGRTVPNKNGQYQHLMIQLQIRPNAVKLVLDTVWPEFKDLTENYYTPQQILWQLSRRGVHILPTDDDYQYSGVKVKDRQAQMNAIRDIAYAVQSFTIRSEINDTGDIRVKMRQNPDYENVFLEDQEKDWKKIRWGDKDKCWVDGKGIMQRHYNLQVLLQQHDICLKQCVDRMKYNNEYLLRKTVMNVLELTRVLAFTIPITYLNSKLIQTLKQKIIVK